MQTSTYLLFNGQCETAFQFYAKALNAKIRAMITHAGTPAEIHVAPEWRDKIMHACLEVGNTLLMGSDAPLEHYTGSNGFSVQLEVESPTDAERIFGALSENGTVRMPIQKTFWAESFGMLVDQFGIPWMVNCAAAR